MRPQNVLCISSLLALALNVANAQAGSVVTSNYWETANTLLTDLVEYTSSGDAFIATEIGSTRSVTFRHSFRNGYRDYGVYSPNRFVQIGATPSGHILHFILADSQASAGDLYIYNAWSGRLTNAGPVPGDFTAFAPFRNNQSVFSSPQDNLYIAPSGNNVVRRSATHNRTFTPAFGNSRIEPRAMARSGKVYALRESGGANPKVYICTNFGTTDALEFPEELLDVYEFSAEGHALVGLRKSTGLPVLYRRGDQSYVNLDVSGLTNPYIQGISDDGLLAFGGSGGTVGGLPARGCFWGPDGSRYDLESWLVQNYQLNGARKGILDISPDRKRVLVGVDQAIIGGPGGYYVELQLPRPLLMPATAYTTEKVVSGAARTKLLDVNEYGMFCGSRGDSVGEVPIVQTQSGSLAQFQPQGSRNSASLMLNDGTAIGSGRDGKEILKFMPSDGIQTVVANSSSPKKVIGGSRDGSMVAFNTTKTTAGIGQLGEFAYTAVGFQYLSFGAAFGADSEGYDVDDRGRLYGVGVSNRSAWGTQPNFHHLRLLPGPTQRQYYAKMAKGLDSNALLIGVSTDASSDAGPMTISEWQFIGTSLTRSVVPSVVSAVPLMAYASSLLATGSIERTPSIIYRDMNLPNGPDDVRFWHENYFGIPFKSMTRGDSAVQLDDPYGMNQTGVIVGETITGATTSVGFKATPKTFIEADLTLSNWDTFSAPSPVAKVIRRTSLSYASGQTIKIGHSASVGVSPELRLGGFVTGIGRAENIIKYAHFLSAAAPFFNINMALGAPRTSVSLVNGDANGDDVIDAGDLQVILNSFGQVIPGGIATRTTWPDLDGDLECGPGDLQIVLDNFGRSGVLN